MSAPALLRYRFAARAEALATMRHTLQDALRARAIHETEIARLVLAVDEASSNIIRHAYRDCTPGEIELTVTRARGSLRFRLRDFAPPVDSRCVRPRNLDECRPGGLGINLIDDIMDLWRLRALRRRCGNVLVMFKRLKARSGRGKRDR
ncbi:MAG: ATP-binding protein [Ahniella sp.]|nr:ATP-binding protein [Ahniella sp.]